MSRTAWRLATVGIAFLLAFSFVGIFPVRASALTSDSALPGPLPGYKAAGTVPPYTPVFATISVPLRNADELQSMVEEVSDPSSPLFGHYLTQSQIAQEFLPTQKFEATLSDLESLGLTVELTAMDSMIVVEGSASQLESALGLRLGLYTNGTLTYYSSGGSEFDGLSVYASNATSIMAKAMLAYPGTSELAGNVTYTEASITPEQLVGAYDPIPGDLGKGETVATLDFYGAPTIASDVAKFDSTYGVPSPASFSVVPIGAYDPNLATILGWSVETTLDVEYAHLGAPEASLVMYAATDAIPLSTIIATIVGDDKVNVLSQSFGFPEWEFSTSGGEVFYYYVTLTDQYYALGALEGITFTAATGDGGGGGYSAGPEGNLLFPASSPYVTSVGGTETYASQNANGSVSYDQTAWSNPTFVPDLVNSGGSGGGVSIIEPRPWYQTLSIPDTYVNGRMAPDVAAQGGVNPASLFVYEGESFLIGGTSESSPLVAGLLATVAASVGKGLGLVNPLLYSLGRNSSTYQEAFTPITFGYTIPWTASFGYNLATGWGAPRAGGIATLYKTSSTGSLDVAVGVSSPEHLVAPDEYTPGQLVDVTANISSSAGPVTTGSFSATLQSLSGSSSPERIKFNSTSNRWEGSLTVGDTSGVTYAVVSGTSGVLTGEGSASFFSGYVGTFLTPTPLEPWSTITGLPVEVNATTLAGNSPASLNVSIGMNSYSLETNHFTDLFNFTLSSLSGDYYALVSTQLPAGPSEMALHGDLYGFLPFYSGIGLEGSFLAAPLDMSPGSVQPGGSIAVFSVTTAPENLASISTTETGSLSSDIYYGSNVTATLVNQVGTSISSVNLAYKPCEEALCLSGYVYISGYLRVPPGTPPGLYVITLSASYDSEATPGELTGSFYAEALVVNGTSTPGVSLNSTTIYEGQGFQVRADIRYPDGAEVTHGDYSAYLFPQSVGTDFQSVELSATDSGNQISLSYDAAGNDWVGNATAPSPTSSGSAVGLPSGSIFPPGAYDLIVSGQSFDGVPAISNSTYFTSLYVQPYDIVIGQSISVYPQPSGLAFSGDTLGGTGSIGSDVFLASNTISAGNLTIRDSQIQGSLLVESSTVTLEGVSGGTVVAKNSTLTIEDSDLTGLSLLGSTVSLVASSVKQLSPPLPSISIASPAQSQVYSGEVPLTYTVNGSDVSGVTVSLDGSQTSESSINASALPDGIHSVTVTATQKDGLSSSTTVWFATDGALVSAKNSLQSQVSSESTTISAQGSEIKSQNSTISTQGSDIKTLTDLLYAVSVIAAVGLVVGVVALLRRPKPPTTED